MTRNNQLFLVVVVVVVVVWTVAYRLIGGRFPKPLRGGPVTWGMRWRSAVAALIAVVLAAFALEAARSLLP